MKQSNYATRPHRLIAIRRKRWATHKHNQKSCQKTLKLFVLKCNYLLKLPYRVVCGSINVFNPTVMRVYRFTFTLFISSWCGCFMISKKWCDCIRSLWNPLIVYAKRIRSKHDYNTIYLWHGQISKASCNKPHVYNEEICQYIYRTSLLREE